MIVELKINKFSNIREAELMWAKDKYRGLYRGLRFLVTPDMSRAEGASLFKPVGK